MTVAGFSRVTIDLAIGGGTPLVTGTRVRIVDVVAMLLRGASTADVVESFQALTEADVSEALAYAIATNHPAVTGEAWLDPSDDAPEWTDEMADHAELAIGGKVIRPATGYLGPNGFVKGCPPLRDRAKQR